MALKQDGVVLSFVLNRIIKLRVLSQKRGMYFMIFFCPKQGQAHSWAHLYPNIGRVPPPRDFRIRLGSASVSMEKSRLL